MGRTLSLTTLVLALALAGCGRADRPFALSCAAAGDSPVLFVFDPPAKKVSTFREPDAGGAKTLIDWCAATAQCEVAFSGDGVNAKSENKLAGQTMTLSLDRKSNRIAVHAEAVNRREKGAPPLRRDAELTCTPADMPKAG